MKKRNKTVLAAIWSFAFVKAVPSMISVPGDGLWYSNSIMAFLLWVLMTGVFFRVLSHDFFGKKRKWLVPGIFGTLFSMCMVFGASLEAKESVAFTDAGMWIDIIILAFSFALLVRYVWDVLIRNVQKSDETEGRKKSATGETTANQCAEGEFDKKSFFLRALSVFICWFPVFLAVWPGFFVYDARDELLQVINGEYSTHHPLLHVLFMGKTVQSVYELSGSYNLGIACYTLLQMILLAVIFSLVIGILQKEGMKKRERVLLTLYFGFFPVIVMFALCSAKDGLFMGMLLLSVVLFRRLTEEGEAFFRGKGQVISLILSCLFMLLLRHNAFYAFAVFAVCYLFLCKKTGVICKWKQTAGLFAVILVGYLLLNQGLTLMLDADDSEHQELLTVPIQQMSRVYKMGEGAMSPEDVLTLSEILPEKAMARYVPKISDGVKMDFDNEAYAQNPSKYLKLWIKLGLKNPFTYANAWLMTSYGFWYPDTVIDVYRGNEMFTFTYGDSSYFGFETEEPGVRQSKLPVLEEWYRKLSLEITQQKVPVLSMLFSPGFVFWVVLFFAGFLCYLGMGKKVVAYLLPMLIWLTFLLGPTYLVRYVVFLWCLAPILLYDVGRVLRSNI